MKAANLLFISAFAVLPSLAEDIAPKAAERQLPTRMHSQMKVLPRVAVGQANADIVGRDNRALQAAVDYIARLGGGTVEIGAGEYVMRDSLHLARVCHRSRDSGKDRAP